MSGRRWGIFDPSMKWLGRRSFRELALLWVVLGLVSIYLLGDLFVLDSQRDLRRERIRLRASKAMYEKLERLVERRDEIMAQASGLVDEYLESQELDVSTLLLSRIDHLRGNRVELVSVYPLRSGEGAQRFRTKLLGPPGDLARLFFALGEGAPPILLNELALASAAHGGTAVSATAMLEVEEKALPEAWLRSFSSAVTDRSEEPRESTVAGRRAVRTMSPFPYKAIDRRGVFQPVRPARNNRRLETAAPTIQSLIQKLTLLGVIWGDEATAIIEDKGAKHVHYRGEGQFIGELEIIEITRSSVTLRYKEEEGRLE